jgi:hypothetical protein
MVWEHPILKYIRENRINKKKCILMAGNPNTSLEVLDTYPVLKKDYKTVSQNIN